MNAVSRRAARAFLVVLMLLAGGSYLTAQEALPPALDNEPPINLNVKTFDIAAASYAPSRDPYVGHKTLVSPVDTMKAWAGKRINAVGEMATETAVFTIRRASLKKTGEPETYRLILAGEITVKDVTGKVVATAPAESQSERTLTIATNPQVRQAQWQAFIFDGILDFDKKMSATMRDKLKAFVVEECLYGSRPTMDLDTANC